METDPYAGLIALMRGQGDDANSAGDSRQAGLGAAPVRMRLGEVVSVKPLKVRTAGQVQPPSALRINERLVKGAKWKVKVTSPDSDYKDLSGPIEGPVRGVHGMGALIELKDGKVHSRDTTIDKATVEQLELDLEPGDTVLLITEDDQVFYIVMKVVNAV